jgi:hypothetical protein
MATSERTIQLSEASYTLLMAVAHRRGIDPNALADELVCAGLYDASYHRTYPLAIRATGTIFY